MKNPLRSQFVVTTIGAGALIGVACGGGSDGGENGAETSDKGGTQDNGDSDQGGSGSGSGWASNGTAGADSGGTSSNADGSDVDECVPGWDTYDASENSYRLDDGAGWINETADGCYLDKLSTWLEWGGKCAPGSMSHTYMKFWAGDTIATDDPDYDRNNNVTIVNKSDETLSMGIQMLSKNPVAIERVDFVLRYPAELLEFDHIERHWASIKRDEPPSRFLNVEVLEPGLLSFTWDMSCIGRIVDKGDIPVASMFFTILQAGEGKFEYPKLELEPWTDIGNMQWKLQMDPSEMAEHRPVWITMVDGTDGPVRSYWDTTLIVRDE